MAYFLHSLFSWSCVVFDFRRRFRYDSSHSEALTIQTLELRIDELLSCWSMVMSDLQTQHYSTVDSYWLARVKS
jgi:hypothetical protein